MIYYNSLKKRQIFNPKTTNRVYPAQHGLIYYTLKLTWSFRKLNWCSDIHQAYIEAGWNMNHEKAELKELFEMVSEKAELIPKNEFDRNTHYWNA